MNAPLRNDGLELISGNHAVAWGVRLAAPDVAPVYPITPQTPILEKLIAFQSEGAFPCDMITPESEHSAMAAAIAASATGARVFTATSSQGLLLMHELLHYASGARLPIIMFNVNRTPAAPWGFWPDQTDSLAQRDTGWVQFYSESPQESLDTVIQAFRIAEAAEMPVMVNHDAFYVSHAVEPVAVPDAGMVTDFLPRRARDHVLAPGSNAALAAPAGQAEWNRARRQMEAAMARIPDLTDEAARLWADATGRGEGVLERYRCDGARLVFVTMGSMAGTARVAVDALREAGEPVGLVRLRLFRPFPRRAVIQALSGVKTALVLDRNHSPGLGGIVHQELTTALYGAPDAPQLFGILAGVGGLNVPAETLVALARDMRDAAPNPDPIWLEDRT
ncbi:MAG TPA: pyruvate ferredoxin oxidoreductase, partial [Aliiroseovarius sp.]|nr:pyruvate ferredoxin oxidoreductase [Aliiroseovarius sp.]